jgi:CRISPR/Cas system-associated protein endoribonuclease Cas2
MENEVLDPELEKIMAEEDIDDEIDEILPESPDGDGAIAIPNVRHSMTTLEVMARITDNKIETREFIDEWLLLTFDIPTTKEGNKARTEFYKKAYALGAVMNTESVYLAPWSAEAELMAMELANVSNSRVIVWSRAKTTAEQSHEITRRYDAGLRKILKLVEKRIDALEYMVQKQYYKKAQRFTIKTERLMDTAEKAIARRGSAQLLILSTILNQRFNQIFARI